MSILIHKHRQPITRDHEIKKILETDNLEAFKKINTDDIFDNFRRTICNCNKITLLTCVLTYNTGTIARYLVSSNICKPDIHDFITASSKSHELFIWFILRTDLSRDNFGVLINILGSKKNWILLQFLHMYGYRAYDIKKFFSKLDESNTRFFMKYYSKKINSSTVTNNKISDGIIINNYTTDLNKKSLSSACKFRTLDYIKHITNNSFELDKQSLNAACIGLNIPVIDYIIKNTQLELTEKNMNVLLLLTVNDDKPKLRRRRRRSAYRYGIHHPMRSCINKFKAIDKDFYNLFMINMIKQFVTNKNRYNTIHSIVKKTIDKHILLKNYTLVEYIVANYPINLLPDSMDNIVLYNIKEDNLESLRTLYKIGIIKPIYISTQPYFLDTAYEYDAINIMKHMVCDLSMICSPHIKYKIRHKIMRRKSDPIENIKLLEFFGYPFETDMEILKIFCNRGSVDVIKYLISRNITLKNSLAEYSIAAGQFSVANIILRHNNKITLTGLLDRVTTIMYNERFLYRTDMYNINVIRHLHKMGATGTHKTVNILLKFAQLRSIMYVYQNFDIKADLAVITNFLSKGNQILQTRDDFLVTFLHFLETQYDYKVYEQTEEVTNNIISNLIKRYDIKTLDHIIGKTKYKFSMADIYSAINFYYRGTGHKLLETIMYIESKGVEITKDVLKICIVENCMTVVRYIANKYQFKYTLKDVHNSLVVEYISIIALANMFRFCDEPPTPYTVQIITYKYCNRWNGELVVWILNKVKKVTQEVYNHIVNSKITHIINALKNVTIVDYVIKPEEIADHLIENQWDNDVIEPPKELDYIQQVVAEADQQIDKISQQ
jgi:hypothetical protein